MTGGRGADAIVIGAGVVGAAVARALVIGGMDVVVLEAASPGAGTTGGGMGHIVVLDDSPAQLGLCVRSTALLREMADDLPRDVELTTCGTLWVASDEDELAAARAKQAVLASAGVESELLDAAQMAEAEPELRRGLAGGLRVPGDAVVYPPALAGALLARAVAAGARVHAPVRARRIDGRVVQTDAGEYEADVIVNAAGVDAPGLSPGAAIVPRKGHLVITERYAPFCAHQLVELGYMKSAHASEGSSVAFNLQPRLTGQVLIGSSRELAGADPSINRALLRRMLERAVWFTPRLVELRAARTWTAFRPATADGLPLIGRAPEQEHVWLAAGHEGLGITTALGTAELLAELVLGRAPTLDPEPYSPARAA